MIDIILLAFWLMLPAYIANPAAALFGGGKPIDFGKKFWDDKRIFGDGKTYRGFVVGCAVGAIVGLIQVLIAPYLAPYVSGIIDPTLLLHTSYIALLTMPVGALLGDLTKSFLKRRLGFKRGAMLPLADQLDFVLGAWILTLIFDPMWVVVNFTLSVMLVVLVMTPVLHLATNFIGFKMGKKDVPW